MAETISSVGVFRIERHVYTLVLGDKRAEFAVYSPSLNDKRWTACKAGLKGKDTPMDFVQVLAPGLLSIECAGAMAAAIQMATDWLIEKRATSKTATTVCSDP